MRLFSLWRDMDDDDKVRLTKTVGLIMAVFTVFTLLSLVSYLFTWKYDQSHLLVKVSDLDYDVRNLCGSLGFRWSDLLVRRWLGLGGFALTVILFAVSVRLLMKRWHFPMLRTVLLTVVGGFLVSFVLAFISRLFGLGNSFGGGLGGQCGDTVVTWSVSLLGGFITALLLICLIVFWLYLASRRFSVWFNSLGEKKTEETVETEMVEEPVRPLRPSPVHEAVPEPAPAPEPLVSRPVTAPVPQPAPQPVPQPAPADNRLEVIKDDSLSTKVTKDLPRINVRDELPKYEFPSLELLEEHASDRYEVSDEELERNNNKIRSTLGNYKIQVNDVKAIVGPTVTLYKVYPAPGVKISDIKKLQEDIGMYLHARGVRVVTLTDSVGIEVANDHPSIVPMRAVLNDDIFRKSKGELPIAIGYTIQQKVKVFDLADAPHLLVAGATKQGKSVGLNAIVASLLYAKHPSELKLVFIDPKMVEFSSYASLLKHYLAVLPCNDEREELDNAIIKKADKADKVLKSLCIEMDQRYELLSKALVPNIKLYNEKYRDRHL
ncbi:MAG: DNA translocase FtsK 4TM domain-containing protein, partial [Bacteroidales bacterium]|nr:DNA translocase FtsK 4TM domain-containing protein [Bacteroidales bacterium]